MLPCCQGAPEFETFAVMDPKLPPGRTGVDRAKGPFRWATREGGGLLRWDRTRGAQEWTGPRGLSGGATGGGGLLKRDRAHNKCAMYRMFSCSLLAVGCGVGCCSGDCLTAVSRTLAQHVSKSYQYSGI
jgi:hypothetical protein